MATNMKPVETPALRQFRERVEAAIAGGEFASSGPCDRCHGTGITEMGPNQSIASAIGTRAVAVAAFRKGSGMRLDFALELMRLMEAAGK